jgi:chromosome partitioning protein
MRCTNESGWLGFPPRLLKIIALRRFQCVFPERARKSDLQMIDQDDLFEASARSRRMQKGIREDTFAPETAKSLRRFSSWEVSELILRVHPRTFTNKLRTEPDMPSGEVEGGKSGMRWFNIDEINQIRSLWREKGKLTRQPVRPRNKRAIRVASANFKGGSGKSTTALHFAHAAALDGYRVLVVDFDPQATLSHSMGLVDVEEERTVWGIIARDLAQETERMNLKREVSGKDQKPIRIPESISGSRVLGFRAGDFIARTCWPTIDIIGSCANAAFVEFASAQYRMANTDWTFFAAVDRFLARLPDDAYDVVIFDLPPAIGYQSLNAVFAADVLYIPTGPGYWEYDSTTSFIAQLSEALTEISVGFQDVPEVRDRLPKRFADTKILITRYEASNDLHVAMRAALGKVFGDWLTRNPVEMTRAVDQSGRFLQSIYEIDYRLMTRETWKRARATFDAAYGEFRDVMHAAWETVPEARGELETAQ